MQARSRYQGRPSRPSKFDDKPKVGSDQELLTLLRGIDGSSYGAYKRALGKWSYPGFTVHLDRIQSDPYAPPSSLRVVADPTKMGLPPEVLSTVDQQTATGDFLIRAFRNALEGARGPVSIVGTTQEILSRSAAVVTPERVELRIQVQLPARGRSVLGKAAATIFSHTLPDAVNETFDFWSEDAADHLDRLLRHVHTYEDHVALLQSLEDNQWVTFINDGAVLARRSGISQLPMEGAVPFESPRSLRQTVTLPHAGDVTGMAIEPGITLIVGGGYHGKSTVLSAIQRGVYAHVPGDGRELVATLPEAVKIRAADGRPVTKVDVSPFINHLPTGANTREFSTQNASGSTSQAASIIEALGMECPLLLIDEDTSATNLMIRDERMRELVVAAQEPITPLIDRIRGLAGGDGTDSSPAETTGAPTQVSAGPRSSVILVMGGSGAYLDVADRVLQMDAYRCEDVTEQARAVCEKTPRERTDIPGFPALTVRSPKRLRPTSDRPKTRSAGVNSIILDREVIDVYDVEQIVDPGQTEAIAWAVRGVLEELADGQTPLRDLLNELQARLDAHGFEVFTHFGARRYPAFMARPRMVDVAAAINRRRNLQITDS